MQRKIVRIDEEKCDGCGLCVDACHEGALRLVNGKARLVSESYCDGLGDCLPECPTGAISIEEREAAAFDEEAVKKNMENKCNAVIEELACGCPGTHARVFERSGEAAPEDLACGCPGTQARAIERSEEAGAAADNAPVRSQLRQWPCQIKLTPANASYLDKANLLVAADCTAYAYANIHNDFMRKKITVIGCPKLDNIDYTEKMTEILKVHDLKSITVLRMEVPCCGGIVNAVKQALINSGKMIPWSVVTISTDGKIIED